jgi:hypothetical protein
MEVANAVEKVHGQQLYWKNNWSKMEINRLPFLTFPYGPRDVVS